MPRNLYGNSLPSVAESRDSDIFYDINTGESYVFDNGQWNELPQTPGGGGGDLPEPTVADAGKILGVDDEGEYALVEGGGGSGGSFVITLIQETLLDPVTFDKTYAQIKSAVEQHQTIELYTPEFKSTILVVGTQIMNPDETVDLITLDVDGDNGGLTVYRTIYEISNQNVVTVVGQTLFYDPSIGN